MAVNLHWNIGLRFYKVTYLCCEEFLFSFFIKGKNWLKCNTFHLFITFVKLWVTVVTRACYLIKFFLPIYSILVKYKIVFFQID